MVPRWCSVMNEGRKYNASGLLRSKGEGTGVTYAPQGRRCQDDTYGGVFCTVMGTKSASSCKHAAEHERGVANTRL